MRRLVIALVALVVLVGVLVLVDVGAATYTEQRISRTLRESQRLPTDPSVSVAGFPFLTQLVDGRYERVDIEAADVPAPDLGPVSVSATLRDVAVPASQVLSGSISSFTAGEVSTEVRVPATTLGQRLDVPDLQITPAGPGPAAGPGASGAVLTGTASAGILRQVVSVQAELSVARDGILVRATDVALGRPGGQQTRLPGLLAPLVLNRISRTVPVGALPFNVTPTAVRVEGSDLVLVGDGTNVTVSVPPA